MKKHIMHSNQAGFTLVEVLMTLLIFAVVLGVVANVFFTTQGLYGRTTQRADQQMSARAGLTLMVEELRRAGADPDPIQPSGVTAIMSASQDTVRVQSENNDIVGIQTAEPSEDVRYYYDANQDVLFRDPGTGPAAMINNVTAFSLQYFDAANNVLGPMPLSPNLRAQVRSIGITITTETNSGGELTVNTRVGLRNN